MEQAAGILVFVTGFSYVFVGAYLLRRSSWIHKHPEFFLGLALLLNGCSYGFSEVPLMADLESIMEEFSFAGRIAAGASSVMIAMFVLRVFRPDESWAVGLVWASAALIVTGLGISVVEGDWEGYLMLTYKGLWIDSIGGFVPYVWLSSESFRKYAAGRRALRLGIGDALVCNRFLLIAVYATFAASSYFVLAQMYIMYEKNGFFSAGMDLALCVVEIGCLAALWTSFASPAFYRRWITGKRAETG